METKNIKRNIATGASAAAGAVAGTAASMAISQEINATEVPEQQPIDLSEAATTQASSATPTPKPEPDPDPIIPDPVIPDPDDPVIPDPDDPVIPDPDPDPVIEVIATDTVVTSDYGPVDVAAIKVDDQPMLLVDVDQDHQADILIVDVNNNNNIEDNEMFDVTNQQIPMPQELQESQTSDNFAQVTDPDYTNDANVDDYLMA